MDDPRAAAAEPVDTSHWSLPLLDALEWKRLAELCAAFFDCLGFTSRTQGVAPDGSTRMALFLRDAGRPSLIAECKPWKSREVGLPQVRELLSAAAREDVHEASMITLRGYEAAARNFAPPPGIELVLIDGQEFLEAISLLPAREQSRLLELATAGDFATPTCPGCGAKMVLRKEVMTEDPFWSCADFPRCKRTYQEI